ncbi:MAG: hypothetical protein ACO1N3_02385 [Gammaproteobacteria bacterium]
MIIYCSKSAQNRCAIKALVAEQPQQTFYFHDDFVFSSNESNETLILLDLSANGLVQNFISPEVIAEKLKNTNILNHIKDIRIMISDIIPEQPISVFAWELSKEILELDSNLSIEIFYIGKTSDTPLLISPPEEGKNDWKIYNLPVGRSVSLEIPTEIQNHIVPLSQAYFSFFRAQMQNTMFEGSMDNLFKKHGYNIDPELVKKTYSFHTT